MGYPVIGYMPAAYQPRLSMVTTTTPAPVSKPFITWAEGIGLLLGIGLGVFGALEDSPFLGGAGASLVATSLFSTIARASSQPTVEPA